MSDKQFIKRSGATVLAAAFSLVVFVSMSAAPASAVEIDNSILRGGRLYDNWIAEMKERDPFPSSHPAYPKKGKFTAQPERTWRCVECHGWDYMGKDGAYGQGAHYTGIKGIRDFIGVHPARIIAVMKDDTHSFQDQVLFDDGDFKDLAAFVSRGQVDMDKYIDRETRKAKGDGTKHRAYYQTICSTCHGTDGAEIRTMLPLGKIANDNPWEALHNMLNGHPNAEMPSLRLLGMDVLVDILAYIQTFPSEYLQASIVRGGRLYDSWFDEINVKPSVGRHAYYPAKGYYAKNPSSTWRCRECHGWDYKGKDGYYAKGKHFTGIKGIGDSVKESQETIVNLLSKQADIVVLGYFAGPLQAGYYRLAKKVTSLASVLVNPLQAVLYPRLSKQWGEGRRKDFLQTVSRYAFWVGMPLGLVVWLSLPLLPKAVELLVGEAYAVAAYK